MSSNKRPRETLKVKISRIWNFVTKDPTTKEEISLKINRNMLFAIISSTFGAGFQHGYNTGIVNIPHEILENFIRDTLYDIHGQFPEEQDVTLIWSVVVSSFPAGGAVGAMVSYTVVHFMGLKWGLLANNVLVFLAAILQVFSKSFASIYMLVGGRFIIGINCGINATLAPMYVTEISPPHLRNKVGTFYHVIVTIAILLSQIFGLPMLLGTKESWPYLFGLIIVPAILMTFTFGFCPESPVHLISKGKDDEAEKAVQWLLRSDSVDPIMYYLKLQVKSEQSQEKASFDEMLREKSFLVPLGISVMIMLARQLSGFSAIIYYSTIIFREAGVKEDEALYATLATSVVMVIMTAASMLLIERAGRKTLMLISLVGMALATLALTLAMGLQTTVSHMEYVSIACVLVYIISFASGMGSIPWIVVSELFTSSARPRGTSIAFAVNWIAQCIVGMLFLPLTVMLKHSVFLIFTVLRILFTSFIFFKVPETKGKTIEEITKELQ